MKIKIIRTPHQTWHWLMVCTSRHPFIVSEGKPPNASAIVGDDANFLWQVPTPSERCASWPSWTPINVYFRWRRKRYQRQAPMQPWRSASGLSWMKVYFWHTLQHLWYGLMSSYCGVVLIWGGEITQSAILRQRHHQLSTLRSLIIASPLHIAFIAPQCDKFWP